VEFPVNAGGRRVEYLGPGFTLSRDLARFGAVRQLVAWVKEGTEGREDNKVVAPLNFDLTDVGVTEREKNQVEAIFRDRNRRNSPVSFGLCEFTVQRDRVGLVIWREQVLAAGKNC